jgi:hypothetical protein
VERVTREKTAANRTPRKIPAIPISTQAPGGSWQYRSRSDPSGAKGRSTGFPPDKERDQNQKDLMKERPSFTAFGGVGKRF